MSEFIAGKVFNIKYPFIRTTFEDYRETGEPVKIDCWKPGVHYDETDFGEGDFYAEGVGEQILTVIDVHKPGEYPTRVFYTRAWKDPEGVEFGKKNLRIMALGNFKDLVKGYRYPQIFDCIEDSQ